MCAFIYKKPKGGFSKYYPNNVLKIIKKSKNGKYRGTIN